MQAAAVAPAPAAAPTRDFNSPLGIWLTEEKEGKVRIEQCGPNLCGYSVDAKIKALTNGDHAGFRANVRAVVIPYADQVALDWQSFLAHY